MGHRNICCDGCQRRDFRGRRFRCMRCLNYDLCGECYDQLVETQEHSVEHPMQLILEPSPTPQIQHPGHLGNPGHQEHQQHQRHQGHSEPGLLLGGDVLELLHLSNCYTCPYCGIFGHTAKKLIEHVCSQHRLADGYVVCPMCAGLPAIELVAIRNLSRHLVLNHIEHANLLEPDTPPLRRFLPRSSQRSRRSRRSLQLDQVQAQSQVQQPPQVVPRGVAPTMSFDVLVQLAWPPDIVMPSSIELMEDQTQDRTVAAPEPEDRVSPVVVEPAVGRGPNERFLLLQWIARQEQQWKEDEYSISRRLRQVLFTEHLLLSMLSFEELTLPEPRQQREQQTGLSKAMSLMSLPWTRAWQASRLLISEADGRSPGQEQSDMCLIKRKQELDLDLKLEEVENVEEEEAID
ncbi:hypothetical protein KR009_010485 [Drosophila setifemur]|nr:hypothetical protein KR009_010485 [Drosophila setifemur]